jgi:6-phosphogluconate dehydrogenase
MEKANIGLVGLGVMGQNLVLNMERNGYKVAVFNRTTEKTKLFLENEAKGKAIIGEFSYSDLMKSLEKPRRILLMVKAGQPVDDVIAEITPYLEKGDILIDGGNSHFMDTERRNVALSGEGFNFIGTGVSGGEEGALWGPSIMPGGQLEAWDALKSIFESISAKAEDGEPCVAYIGPRGAGHFVKMVHNGIEYADMQLIAESYDLLHRSVGLNTNEISETFNEWNKGPLNSYLIEITAEILKKIDPVTGKPLVDVILDAAGQKGTGKWTSQTAFDLSAPTNTIDAAVISRNISALKAERIQTSKHFSGPKVKQDSSKAKLVDTIGEALNVAKILSYAQGFNMMRMASEEYKYELNMHSIAKIWRAGCIIRAGLLGDIMNAYKNKPDLVNLLHDQAFQTIVQKGLDALRKTVIAGVFAGIPVYALSSSLAYFDAYRSEYLPNNLTQAQRDYFGAHTYKRNDMDGVFHTDWLA